jgi:hypothetical protein
MVRLLHLHRGWPRFSRPPVVRAFFTLVANRCQ